MGKESIRSRVILIVALILLEVSLIGGIGVWREYFWDSVQQKNLNHFIILLSAFTGMALLLCVINGLGSYVGRTTALTLRSRITDKLISSYGYEHIEGYEQRVQEDAHRYTDLGIKLGFGLSRAVLTLGVFIVIIVHQASVYDLPIPITYSIIGTLAAYFIARPLIKLNFTNQVVEAKFRRDVSKVVSTSPLEFDGKSRSMLADSYMDVVDSNLSLFKALKKLNYFQSFYNQVTVVVPYIMLAPAYFAGRMLFGVFMQLASSISHIIDSLSYLINSIDDINNLLSCRKRLKQIGAIK